MYVPGNDFSLELLRDKMGGNIFSWHLPTFLTLDNNLFFLFQSFHPTHITHITHISFVGSAYVLFQNHHSFKSSWAKVALGLGFLDPLWVEVHEGV